MKKQRKEFNTYNFSQYVTSEIVDEVVQSHAVDVLEMQHLIEQMWSQASCERIRRSMACHGAPGFSFIGDNVGMKHI